MKKNVMIVFLFCLLTFPAFSYGAHEIELSEELLYLEGDSISSLEEYAKKYNLDVLVDRIELTENEQLVDYVRVRDKVEHLDKDSFYRLSYILNVIGSYYKDNIEIYKTDNCNVLYVEKLKVGSKYEHKGYIIDKSFFESYIPLNAIDKGELINNEFRNKIYVLPSPTSDPLW